MDSDNQGTAIAMDNDPVNDSKTNLGSAEVANRVATRDQSPVAGTENTTELRTDGPTLQEFIDAGYKADNYPPEGYAVREEQAVTGFAAFRYWLIKQMRNTPRSPWLSHAGTRWEVEDLTHDGQLRLNNKEKVVLVPFDERYIPDLLRQILAPASKGT